MTLTRLLCGALALVALAGCRLVAYDAPMERVPHFAPDESLVFAIPPGAQVLVRFDGKDFLVVNDTLGPWSAPSPGGASLVVERR